MKQAARSVATVSALAVLFAGASQSYSAVPFELVISSQKTNYVVREPIRIRAELHNVSGSTARIMEVRYLGPDMECFYLQATAPDGHVERRQSTAISTLEISNAGYTGEPLNRDDAVLVFFYPNFSNVLGSGESAHTLTFEKAGTYRLQLVYEVPAEYAELRGGPILSNEISVSFRTADKIESEILDALWEGDTWPDAAETVIRKSTNNDALSSIIERYPQNELTNYVRMRLANSLSLFTDPNVAIDLLRELQRIAPDFRSEEVAILLARNLGALGRDAEAAALLSESLKQDPLLETNYEFMWTYLRRLYPHAASNPVTQWRVNRLNGKVHPELEIH